MNPIDMPDFWEGLLKGYVKRTFYADTRKKGFADREGFTEGDYRFFVRGISKLSTGFTEERGELPKNYLNQKDLRSGYILYFLPVNALKVAALLGLSNLTFDPDKTMRILDVGSGPGTGMFGVFFQIENRMRQQKGGKIQLRWTLIDQNRDVLNDARNLHGEILDHLKTKYPGWTIESDLQTRIGNLFSERISSVIPREKYDLILASNFLSELPLPKRLPLVEILLRDDLEPNGRMLVMEPALRITTRDLMELHDHLLSRKSAHVHAPCLHQAACPMLAANARDWCHTYIPWHRPAWIEKIDRLAAIQKNYLICSYMILGGPESKPAEVPTNLWRVVSGPLNSKGKSERLLCGPDNLPNLLRIMRLDRDRSKTNWEFDELERGDLVELPNKASKIGRETTIKKIKT